MPSRQPRPRQSQVWFNPALGQPLKQGQISKAAPGWKALPCTLDPGKTSEA